MSETAQALLAVFVLGPVVAGVVIGVVNVGVDRGLPGWLVIAVAYLVGVGLAFAGSAVIS